VEFLIKKFSEKGVLFLESEKPANFNPYKENTKDSIRKGCILHRQSHKFIESSGYG